MASLGLFPLFVLGAVLVLATGVYCIARTRSLIRVLIGMEIITKAVTLLLIAAGRAAGRMGLAQSLVITLIVLEVAVIVVAVSIVLGVSRATGSVDASAIEEIKG